MNDVRIPAGQIAFDVYPGSQFNTAQRRPIAQNVMTGDVVLLPEGTYYIVSTYGDVNSVVRSDVQVQAAKLTDIVVTHRAAVITLKLVNESGGEALANTQWTVSTPDGDVIKELIGAFPRSVLAEGDYHLIARNEGRIYQRDFKVINGVDGEVELLAQSRGPYAAFCSRRKSGGTASCVSAVSAASSGIVCCFSEPRRRIETVRSAASFLPTTSSTGTFASECSRTL